MTIEQQIQWRCPNCLRECLRTLDNPKGCEVCNDVSWEQLEYCSPELSYANNSPYSNYWVRDFHDPYDSSMEEWICAEGMSFAWGDVTPSTKISFRLVGSLKNPYLRLGSKTMEARRREGEDLKGQDEDGDHLLRTNAYADWLDEFGPDVCSIWIYWEEVSGEFTITR